MASWFRSWHGAPTDNKWLVIGRRANVAPGVVSAVAWALFDYASQADDRGSVEGFDVETYAAFSGFDESDIDRVVSAMREKSVIVDGRLAAWDKRQPKREDDSAERVRAFRERKNDSNAMKRSVTHGNNTETDTETDTEQNRTEAEKASTLRACVREAPDAVAVEVMQETRTDADLTRAIVAKMESAGIGVTEITVDNYVAAAMDYGIHAVLSGIDAAASNGKQHKTSYVLACIRNKAQGVAPSANTNGNQRNNGNGRVTPLDRSLQSIEEVREMLRNGGTI